MIGIRRYTMQDPPRVYEVAMALHAQSRDVLDHLQIIYGYQGRSYSSRVPMYLALKVIEDLRTK